MEDSAEAPKAEQPKEEPKEAKKEEKSAESKPQKLPRIIDEIRQIQVSVAINVVVAVIMGWASVAITAMSRAIFAGVAGIVVMIIVGFIVQQLVGKRGRKWWLANGVAMFLLAWLVSWVVFFNMAQPVIA
jgi:uncharacterized membrane protein YGL010W